MEIRRRNVIWRDFNIWRVSLLSGGQKKVRSFFQLGDWPPEELPFSQQFDAGEAKCFLSAGVIFVVFADSQDDAICVYDTSAMYKLRLPSLDHRRTFVAVSCLERLERTETSPSGWKIRVLHASRIVGPVEGDKVFRRRPYRSVFFNETFDLRRDARIDERKRIVFGSFDTPPRLRAVRTSRLSFGVVAENTDTVDGPTALYDGSIDDYAMFDDFRDSLRSDLVLSTYVYTPKPVGQLHGQDLCPTVVNESECIECFSDGTIFRGEFQSCLDDNSCSVAEEMFRIRPDLRTNLSVEQFRELTGLSGMEMHLGYSY